MSAYSLAALIYFESGRVKEEKLRSTRKSSRTDKDTHMLPASSRKEDAGGRRTVRGPIKTPKCPQQVPGRKTNRRRRSSQPTIHEASTFENGKRSCSQNIKDKKPFDTVELDNRYDYN
ncbi:hypothetical protein Trydic_g12835 [Trypoxylus dichotomus]